MDGLHTLSVHTWRVCFFFLSRPNFLHNLFKMLTHDNVVLMRQKVGYFVIVKLNKIKYYLTRSSIFLILTQAKSVASDIPALVIFTLFS